MEWSVDHASPVPQLREADVEDLDELERALEQMAETATNGPPLVVELVGPTGGRLGIGLGPLGSVLSFKASDDPPYFLSAGTTRSLSDEVVGSITMDIGPNSPVAHWWPTRKRKRPLSCSSRPASGLTTSNGRKCEPRRVVRRHRLRR